MTPTDTPRRTHIPGKRMPTPCPTAPHFISAHFFKPWPDSGKIEWASPRGGPSKNRTVIIIICRRRFKIGMPDVEKKGRSPPLIPLGSGQYYPRRYNMGADFLRITSFHHVVAGLPRPRWLLSSEQSEIDCRSRKRPVRQPVQLYCLTAGLRNGLPALDVTSPLPTTTPHPVPEAQKMGF